MADFLCAFEKMILNEGGYTLHQVSNDRGGLTYAGIAQNFHPQWPGWQRLKQDPDDPAITDLVRDFYQQHYWDKLGGGDIESQAIAESLFDFGVNAGVRTAAKLAQLVVGATPDGIIGPKSMAQINQAHTELFVANYALAKIARYAEIVNNNDSQRKFLLGWINRTLEGLA